MALKSGKYFIWAAAFLMFACAVLHSMAWMRAQGDFSPEARPLAALLWFLLGIDWAVIGGLWVLGASKGIAARPLLLLSVVVPVSVAVGLCLTIGPGFFPVYLQLGAAGLLLLGAFRLT
ncbi:hypothetical protein [Ramlibacter sp. WS9]|uniref:hypothetical protein n=1 Tax=Ramlibacter sp. WS9 TaxID=1882741 RepID=UPI00114154CA|nr:hypothetical protein [Ramlibacter sp. WS9]ROZ75095.1 hypothetical protein EEB15_17140 [Ramlibacter sp. WS9]